MTDTTNIGTMTDEQLAALAQQAEAELSKRQGANLTLLQNNLSMHLDNFAAVAARVRAKPDVDQSNSLANVADAVAYTARELARQLQ